MRPCYPESCRQPLHLSHEQIAPTFPHHHKAPRRLITPLPSRLIHPQQDVQRFIANISRGSTNLRRQPEAPSSIVEIEVAQSS